MLKFTLYIISGIIIGVAGTLITINWQEEKLRYELSNPATFGDIVYQNLRVVNDGWNPATQVKIYLRHPSISARNVQSLPVFNLDVGEPELVGGYDRLRRGETVTVTFSFRGQPIEPRQLSVKSDRSVAKPMARDGGAIDPFSLFLGMLVWIVITLAAPALRDVRWPNPPGEAPGKSRRSA